VKDKKGVLGGENRGWQNDTREDESRGEQTGLMKGDAMGCGGRGSVLAGKKRESITEVRANSGAICQQWGFFWGVKRRTKG